MFFHHVDLISLDHFLNLQDANSLPLNLQKKKFNFFPEALNIFLSAIFCQVFSYGLLKGNQWLINRWVFISPDHTALFLRGPASMRKSDQASNQTAPHTAGTASAGGLGKNPPAKLTCPLKLVTHWFSVIYRGEITPPIDSKLLKTNEYPLKLDGWKINLSFFKWSLFHSGHSFIFVEEIKPQEILRPGHGVAPLRIAGTMGTQNLHISRLCSPYSLGLKTSIFPWKVGVQR